MSFTYFHAKIADFYAKKILQKTKISKKPLEEREDCPKTAIILSRRLTQLHLDRSFDQVDHTVDTKLSYDTAALAKQLTTKPFCSRVPPTALRTPGSSSTKKICCLLLLVIAAILPAQRTMPAVPRSIGI